MMACRSTTTRTIATGRVPTESPRGTDPMLSILLEDNHCLAIDKPAGLLSQGDATGDRSAVEEVRAYLKATYEKPGNVYVGLVHRLDRPTSGVLLFAKTSKGAARLSEEFRSGRVTKTYLAVVEGDWPEESGEWEDWLVKDERTNVVSTVPASSPGAQRANLAYRVIRRRAGRLDLELKPTTGRGHQLRVQLASRGLPIVGDRKYGARSSLTALDGLSRIALHAQELRFKHPTRPDHLTIVAPIPGDWPASGGSGGVR
ncbi:RluA family pseudouridine synthase [Tundrisphaera lichenicola]|uniref:RluA family pseudouridine synthase n=1 Tax=Tundrisphaera lichenicola TaxID=2029860 RepID=UPI003EB9FF0C